ncbi:Unknown protein sequence [Pseudomonas amygdali pv. morsprunorum]|nr:Unknown protein sequence [Pseudomonas amygdali pv. morsprunorum]
MTHLKPRIERGQTFGMGQIDISWPATFRDIGSQIHLWLNGTAGVQHVCDLQQSQLGDANACGMGEPQQRHIALWQTASDGCNANEQGSLRLQIARSYDRVAAETWI